MRDIKIFILFVLVNFTFFSCKEYSTDKNKIAIITNTAYFGDTLSLKLNQCFNLIDTINQNKLNIENQGENTIQSNTYTICLNEISEGRCLLNTCDYCDFSRANIKINFINSNNQSNIIKLYIIGCLTGLNCLSPKDTLGFRFCLMQLYPYPDSNNIPIKLQNYIAKIKVEKL